MQITFNNLTDNTNTTSLKEYLITKGYTFPCSGRGICGKCIVYCPSAQPTDRDRRFLSEEDIASGKRLACDKSIVEGMVIEATIESVPRFSDADACAVLRGDVAEVYLVADAYVESRLERVESISATTLKSAVAHALLEMLEKHSVAKATTIYVLGDKELVSTMTGEKDLDDGATIEASSMMLPCDDVTVVPYREHQDSLDYIMERAGQDATNSIVQLVNSFRFRHTL